MEILNTYILPHWPFFGAMLIFAMIGEVMKGIFTKKLAESSPFARIFRATLPLHPVLAGIALGWSNMLPASGGVEGAGGKALYFGAAGVLSSWLFYAIKRYARKKGVEIPIGTPSMPPPEPEIEIDDDLDDDDSSGDSSDSNPPESSDPPPESGKRKSDSDPPASDDGDDDDSDREGDSKPPSDPG
jgi:hypothetical protein